MLLGMTDTAIPPHHELRPLGNSSLAVSPVALGTWPMAGVTSLDVNDTDSIDTLRACADLGINFIDSAYVYGPQGESEQLIRRALGQQRERYVLATKCGVHYDDRGQQVNDGRPETIAQECDESLRRLGTDRVELYYLHSPDPQVPIAESAGAIQRLVEAGKVRYAGASNCRLEQVQEFHSVCPLIAVQMPYNMIQRGIERETIPWCQEHGVAVVVYWALMKGLLGGKISSEADLAPEDNRRTYPLFQGEEFRKNLAFVQRLHGIAESCGRTVAEIVINWTIYRPGITSVLCGARRRWQLEETAAARNWRLSDAQLQEISAALAERGEAVVKRDFS